MNDDLHTFIEPELQTRIAALVMGEASEFERDELEKLIAEKPELVIYQRRMQAIHDLLGETVKPAQDPEWRLSAGKRETLRQAFARKGEVAAPRKQRSGPSAQWRSAISIAACVLVTVILFSLATPVVMKQKSASERATAQSNIRGGLDLDEEFEHTADEAMILGDSKDADIVWASEKPETQGKEMKRRSVSASAVLNSSVASGAKSEPAKPDPSYARWLLSKTDAEKHPPAPKRPSIPMAVPVPTAEVASRGPAAGSSVDDPFGGDDDFSDSGGEGKGSGSGGGGGGNVDPFAAADDGEAKRLTRNGKNQITDELGLKMDKEEEEMKRLDKNGLARNANDSRPKVADAPALSAGKPLSSTRSHVTPMDLKSGANKVTGEKSNSVLRERQSGVPGETIDAIVDEDIPAKPAPQAKGKKLGFIGGESVRGLDPQATEKEGAAQFSFNSRYESDDSDERKSGPQSESATLSKDISGISADQGVLPEKRRAYGVHGREFEKDKKSEAKPGYFNSGDEVGRRNGSVGADKFLNTPDDRAPMEGNAPSPVPPAMNQPLAPATPVAPGHDSSLYYKVKGKPKAAAEERYKTLKSESSAGDMLEKSRDGLREAHEQLDQSKVVQDQRSAEKELVEEDALRVPSKRDIGRKEAAKKIERLQRRLVDRAELNKQIEKKEVQAKQLAEMKKKTTSRPRPKPHPEETLASAEPFSTFSLNVNDVSFKLARVALLEKGQWPDSAKVRTEEFVNAFDYGDPSPRRGEPVACSIEQAAHPFMQQRNLLRIGMKTAAMGRSQPLRLTVLLDNSGSMEREDREASVQAAMQVLAAQLGPQDVISVVGFARQPRLIADRVGGDQAHKLVELIAKTPSEGGTNIEEAIRLARSLAKRQHTEGAQSRVVLITDGIANLGNTVPEELSRQVETMRQEGIAFDACGVGAEGLNDDILEALTRKGDGRYYFLNKPEDADAGFAKQLAGALTPAAKNVKVQVVFNPKRVTRYRLLGFNKHRLNKEDFRNDKVDAAEMAAEEAGNAVYQVQVNPEGQGDLGEVFVRFLDASTGRMVERSWPLPYEAQAKAFDLATPSMQLAGAAAMLGEKLHGTDAGSVRFSNIASTLGKIQAHFASDTKVQDLIRMCRKVK